MGLINFELKNIEEINPYKVGLSWFYFSDAYYSINLPNATLFEYSKEIKKYNLDTYSHKSTVVNYEMARFIEDLECLLENIAIEIPDEIYNLTKNAEEFYNLISDNNAQLEQLYDTLPQDDYYKLSNILNDWIVERTIVNFHLNGHPTISFFRNKHDKINIVWDFDRITEINGNFVPIWSADKGNYEMSYEVFVKELFDFKNNFFDKMEMQIANIITQNWVDYDDNRERRKNDHSCRLSNFEKQLSKLQNKQIDKTDWNKIVQAQQYINQL